MAQIRGTSGNNFLTGTIFRDTIEGLDGNDTLRGLDADDLLQGGGGDDDLFGGDGEDRLEGGLGDDEIYGSSGHDLILGGDSGEDEVHLDILYGESGDDTIYGEQGWDNIYGGSGDDQMFGGDGADLIEFSWEDDSVNGGADNDLFIAAPTGNVGSSVLNAVSGGSGSDRLGVYLIYDDLSQTWSSDHTLTANLTTGVASISYLHNGSVETFATTMQSIENLSGGINDESLTGNGGSNHIEGIGGNDTISGEGGNDTLLGGSITAEDLYARFPVSEIPGPDGDDNELHGGSGNDQIHAFGIRDIVTGDAGNDTIWVEDPTFMELDGGSGSDTLYVSSVITDDVGYLLGSTGSILGFETIRFHSGYFGIGDISVHLDELLGNSSDTSVLHVLGDVGNDTIEAARIDADTDLVLDGLAGNDDLKGGGGNDTLYGGTGNDTLNGDSGNDTLDGGGNDDILKGGGGADQFLGGSGTDSADYGNENDLAGPGTDYIIDLSTGLGSAGAAGDTYSSIENVNGSNFKDEITGDSLANVFDGNDGSDTLYGKSGNDTLNGGNGTDYLDGGAGSDVMDGGTGSDTAWFTEAASSLTVVLADAGLDGSATGQGTDIVRNVEHVVGAAGFNNVITGNNVGNTIKGGGGTDLLVGLGGNDNLFGNIGRDTIIGGSGNDTISGFDGNDILDAGTGNDVVQGDTGIDRIQFTLATAGIDGDLETGIFTGQGTDTVSGVEIIIGSGFDDEFKGDSVGNVMLSGSGDDLLEGRAGNDTLLGGTDGDVLDGGEGNDILDGGADLDWAQFLSVDAGVSVVLGEGSNAGLSTGQGTDTLLNMENVWGSGRNDVVSGNSGDNILKGAGGTDILNGAGGQDHLLGHSGNDTLQGGQGNDTLDGGVDSDWASYAGASNVVFVDLSLAGSQDTGEGFDTLISIENLEGSAFADVLTGSSGNNILRGLAGRDTLTGGDGQDIFDFDATTDSGNTNITADVIEGFVQGEDLIDLSTIDALASTLGDDTFTFIGEDAFSAEGQIRYVQNDTGTNTFIQINNSGNSGIDMTIWLNGAFEINPTDFIL